MADPGFPVGGRATVRRGHGPLTWRFLVKMYAKTKELGPIGGAVSKIYLPMKLYPQYIFMYENQSKTYQGYVFASGNT